VPKPTCYIVDCWDVRTPDEFWDLYLREVIPEGVEHFGRNEDAFRDALTGGGPGWPGDSECTLEIIHVDKLIANGHTVFVAFLEALGRELADSPHVELNVVRPRRLRPTLPRAVKLMAEYECWPLWGVEPDVGNIDPAELPISDTTREALDRWAAAYDATLDQDYPPDSGFPDEESETAFELEGLRLWRALRGEFGDRLRVLYRDLEPEEDVLPPSASASPEARLRAIFLRREVVQLLGYCREMVSEETIAEGERLLDHGEWEMAFEGLALDLMQSSEVPYFFNRDRVRALALKLGLNRESVFDGRFWEKLEAWVHREPPAEQIDTALPSNASPEGFCCPECGEASLAITKAIELHPDARWNEITLQLLWCRGCDFEGVGVYKENNWGASEVVERHGYRTPISTRVRLSELIEQCPKRSDRRCECSSCATLSATDAQGNWNWLQQQGVGERFPIRRMPKEPDEGSSWADMDHDHFFEDKVERSVPRPAPKPAVSEAPSASPTPTGRRRYWGVIPIVFWSFLVVFLAGGAVAWYEELSTDSGLRLGLREDWSWPPALASVGSAVAYAASALLATYLVGTSITWLIDGARSAYRKLRG